jgi:GT2 family glycosyltransferase
MISASLVLYETPDEQLELLLHCLEKSSLRPFLHIVDNSPLPRPRASFEKPWIQYTATGRNLGYGAGHNIALRKVLQTSSFHFILNPDVRFDETELEKIVAFAESDPSIGLVMPKIIYPDGSLQYLCKLIPTPGDLLMRRIAIPLLRDAMRRKMERFELRFTGYDQIMEVPVLSGCFMLLGTEALRKVGLFDERFVMYLEDFDLSRRIHEQFRTVFYSGALVTHDHAKYSYRSLRGLQMHASSAIKYFNKWGWLIDPIRRDTNRKILQELSLTGTGKNGFESAQATGVSRTYGQDAFVGEVSAPGSASEGELVRH